MRDRLAVPVLEENIVGTFNKRSLVNPLDPIEVTQRLVQIPSHRNEGVIGRWISGYLHEHAPHSFRTHRLLTGDRGRDTIITANTEFPDLVVITHIDTVDPWAFPKNSQKGQSSEIKKKNLGQYDPFGGTIEDGKLYGRGASDQKAGSAAMLTSLASFKGHDTELPPMMLAFTADEEGEFRGMYALVEHFKKLQGKRPGYRPKFILSTGSDGEIGWQCRGIAALELVMNGRTGHAAMRTTGREEPVNAYLEGTAVLVSVAQRLQSLESTGLGVTTFNATDPYGGLEQSDGKILHGRENQVPDYFSVTTDFRTNAGMLNGRTIDADLISELIKEEAENRGLQLRQVRKKLDVPAWMSRFEDTLWLQDIIKRTTHQEEVPLWIAAQHGYDEMALLWDAVSEGGRNNVGAAIWGIGISPFHGPDEHVNIADIPVHKAVLLDTFRSDQFK